MYLLERPSRRKGVTISMFLRDMILTLLVFNLIANPILGLMILLRWPCGVWPMPWPDHWREKPDTKTNEKGEHTNEETVA
jgi:hypothetical protein